MLTLNQVMRILILNIILTLSIVVSNAQEYEFKRWPYPWGPPVGGRYTDSLLDYDKDKDTIFVFTPNEHIVSKIKIIDKSLRFNLWDCHSYYIAKIEIIDLLWCSKLFDSDSIKKIEYCILPYEFKENKAEFLIGTFAAHNNYISFIRTLILEKKRRYYVSQCITITRADGKGRFYKKINRIKNKTIRPH